MSSKIDIIGDDYEVINIEEENHLGISFLNNNGDNQIVSCTLSTSTNSATFNHDSIYITPYGQYQSSCDKYQLLSSKIDILRAETNDALELYLKKELFYENNNSSNNYITYIESIDSLYAEKRLTLADTVVMFTNNIDDDSDGDESSGSLLSWLDILDRPMFGDNYIDANYDFDSRYYRKGEIESLLATKLNSSSYSATDILTKIKSVDGADSGLDADTLDGLHNGELTAIKFKRLDTGNGNIGVDSNSDANMLTNGGMTWNYYGDNYWRNTPSGMSYGSIIHLTCGASLNGHREALSGQFAWDIYHNTTLPTRNLWFRAANSQGFGSDWKQVAFTSSNVATATKLKNSRTIWGQSFNGSANVSGNMTGVANIVASGSVVMFSV